MKVVDKKKKVLNSGFKQANKQTNKHPVISMLELCGQI